MMSVRMARSPADVALDAARSRRGTRHPVDDAAIVSACAGERTVAHAATHVAVFEAWCFAGLNSTGCVLANLSFVDV
jgi:hypothetical protein